MRRSRHSRRHGNRGSLSTARAGSAATATVADVERFLAQLAPPTIIENEGSAGAQATGGSVFFKLDNVSRIISWDPPSDIAIRSIFIFNGGNGLLIGNSPSFVSNDLANMSAGKLLLDTIWYWSNAAISVIQTLSGLNIPVKPPAKVYVNGLGVSTAACVIIYFDYVN